MGYFQLFGGHGCTEPIGQNTGTTKGTVLTNGGVAHTKSGTWDQLTASTSRQAAGMIIVLSSPDTVNHDFLVDIAFGAGGSEKKVATNLLHANNAGTTSGGTSYSYFLP